VCAGYLKPYKLSNKVKVEGLLLQRVHRAKDSNKQRLFEILLQGVRAGNPFERLEFASDSSEGKTPLKTSKEGRNRTTSKGDAIRSHRIEVKFRRDNIQSFGRSQLKHESRIQNSPWRVCEVARTVGSSGAIWMVRSLCEGSVNL
jgi:hypothetical protein